MSANRIGWGEVRLAEIPRDGAFATPRITRQDGIRNPNRWPDQSTLLSNPDGESAIHAPISSAALSKQILGSRAKSPASRSTNMRQNRVCFVTATCEACGHAVDVNCDAMPETVSVPDVAKRFRCSRRGGRKINTRPAWRTQKDRHGVPDFKPPEP